MSTPGRPGRRSPLAAFAIAAATLILATACGSAAKQTSGAGTPVAAEGSASASVPTQDVVSDIQTDPALKAELPAAIAARGTLLLGTTQPTGLAGLPHDGVDAAGKEVGLDVDLRDAIAKKLGVTWDVEYGTFQTIIPGTQNGKFDVGWGNFGVTKAREQIVDFATYLTDGQAFLGASSVSATKISTLTDLCGYTVATSPGSTFQQILTDGAAKCSAAGKKPYTVQYFSDSAPIFLGLANGKIDVMFGPTLSVKYDASHVPDTKFLGQISSTPVGAVTAKGSPLAKPLSDAVNALIADGSYAKIFAKWGVPDTAVKTSQVNPDPGF
ncbi:transporter substrate-binding domain-containing protein [Catenulispora sp. NL8]|uniref:Transporter substrate-binding domain-containing protein n=1 Tax=Catenulispora pinistramenti TaxID=2705254 RepID=A0ABS5L437_9ACTN|nr:transporter substrate-binding domain-containing protein [Catenulispora pinistramenti]MBS2552899.1 transporter substrate-binding domain-containing protein [Catenulispora pinistramenti]